MLFEQGASLVWANNQSNDYGFFVPAAHFLICPPLAKNSLTALFNKSLSGFCFLLRWIPQGFICSLDGLCLHRIHVRNN